MPSEIKQIQLGLCCLNTTLRKMKPSIYCSRKIEERIIEEKGIDELKARALQNCRDLIPLIEWNEANGIRVFRLPSDMFPHKTNPKVPDYTLDFADAELKAAGALAKKYGHRLTFHPGKYNVLGTDDPQKLANTIADLDWHAEVLDRMEMPAESVIVIQEKWMPGVGRGSPKEWRICWAKNYKKLPEHIRRRLVLENYERGFLVQDCLDISKMCGVPVVLNTYHFDCYSKINSWDPQEPLEYYIPLVLETWGDIKPKFHVSEQGSGKIGHHSDFIEEIPDELLEIPELYDVDIDIMVEAKKKEMAIFKLYAKYPDMNCYCK